jgi:8-oxo-dGTP pyrophosphatase MutT (NUDIX family)
MASNRAKKPQVRAAGGVVWREAVVGRSSGASDAGYEVVLIHRPRYDDWSFPKGKLDPGEASEAAALREVEEETGVRGELEVELPAVRYVDGKGRLKEVRYWMMRPVSVGSWSPNREVDRRLWVPLDEAPSMLTYEHDRELQAAVSAALRLRSEAP